MVKFLLLFIFVSYRVFAGECTGPYKDLRSEISGNPSKDKHDIFIEKATEIYIGKVVSGFISDKTEPSIHFNIQVTHAIKGNPSTIQNLKAHEWMGEPAVVLGSYYIIFEYGPKELSTCAPYINLDLRDSSNLNLAYLKNIFDDFPDRYSLHDRNLFNSLYSIFGPST